MTDFISNFRNILDLTESVKPGEKPVTSVEFEYRGLQCHTKHYSYWVNGYMRGKINVADYWEADEKANAHGGFTYDEKHDDGTVTLGFDTAHAFDGPETQNDEYVIQAIREAVDSLYDAGLIEGD